MSNVDIQYEIEKRAVCRAIIPIKSFPHVLSPSGAPEPMSIRKTLHSFGDWLSFFGNQKDRPVTVPQRGEYSSAYSKPWSLAWVTCHMEIYLKVGDLVEMVQDDPATQTQSQNIIDQERLSVIRKAREITTDFLLKFGQKISAEAIGFNFARDREVVDAALRIENLQEKFALLVREIETRPNVIAKLRTTATNPDPQLHDWLERLKLRPIGLYPSS